MISQFSTIRLHFASKYFMVVGTSNWITSIYKMHLMLDCEPIKKKIVIGSNNNDNDDNKDLECIELEMPWRPKQQQEISKRFALLSNNLKNLYLESDWQSPHRFNIEISTDETCDDHFFG